MGGEQKCGENYEMKMRDMDETTKWRIIEENRILYLDKKLRWVINDQALVNVVDLYLEL